MQEEAHIFIQLKKTMNGLS